MKLTGKKIKSMLLCMMLTMAMAITAVGCGSKTENTADTWCIVSVDSCHYAGT